MNKWLAALLTAGLGFSFVAHAAIDETIRVKDSIEINAPADKVWATVGNFGDVSWLPGIAKTELVEGKADEVGAKRVLTLDDGGKVNETLTSYDTEGKTLKFEITESVLPLREFGATIKVEAAGDKSIVTWRTMFKRKDPSNPGAEGQDDATAKAAVEGILQSGLANLKKVSE
jgi:mxaD protein